MAPAKMNGGTRTRFLLRRAARSVPSPGLCHIRLYAKDVQTTRHDTRTTHSSTQLSPHTCGKINGQTYISWTLNARTRRSETVFILCRKTSVPNLMKATGVNLDTQEPSISQWQKRSRKYTQRETKEQKRKESNKGKHKDPSTGHRTLKLRSNVTRWDVIGCAGVKPQTHDKENKRRPVKWTGANTLLISINKT